MHIRRLFLILILTLMSVGIVVAWATREREPVYGGKRLSEWVDEPSWWESGTIVAKIHLEPKEAEEAINAIGTLAECAGEVSTTL